MIETNIDHEASLPILIAQFGDQVGSAMHALLRDLRATGDYGQHPMDIDDGEDGSCTFHLDDGRTAVVTQDGHVQWLPA